MKENVNRKFYDTPGLADEELRKKAGEAISSALKEGGKNIINYSLDIDEITHYF